MALIHELAATHSYAEIAEALNAAGWRSAFGRRFTREHVGYICRRDGFGRGKRHRGQTGAAPQEPLIQADPMES